MLNTGVSKDGTLLSQDYLASLSVDGNHGLERPVNLQVKPYEEWLTHNSINFFNYFMPEGSISGFVRQRPVWQRFSFLYPEEARKLEGIARNHMNRWDLIYESPIYSRQFHQAYSKMSELVDESDKEVDRDLYFSGHLNDVYILNETPGQLGL